MRILLLALIPLALLACKMEPDPIRIGGSRWPGHAPLYLADELQWLEPAGLRLVEYPNASGVLRGFRNGLLDAALLTLDEALTLQSSGLDLEILLVTDLSAGADVLYARPPILAPADLRGRRVGVESSALGAFFLSRILDRTGLRPDELSVVSLPIHEQAAALGAGRVDALVSFASQGPTLEALGARRIFDSRELPGEIIDVLVVDRRRVAAGQRRRLKSLWYEALHLWQASPDCAGPALAQRLGLGAQTLQDSLAGLLAGDPALNRQMLADGRLLRSIERLNRYMVEHRLLSRPARPRELLASCGAYGC
ncbi:ABC transporter substrate-binding protein [Azotobacter chroococcum]|uniref:ABC-type nitrate/sulfonate/bicarbonate transport system, periplasmic component n=1 Tax=Azotobacter chroococcum NCIMB 8003 TaxID=1328314 RepID=A0A0C4WVK4_9GAMM|nr:ABC transporter substrate-binding protein [Azotobacter chroococcum]AJE22737.1 ABC-type nitrate/sulfonate/bicarbonate transport system, periplasmic component [Azotobacter chroococcum NCIMB 8003]